MKDFTTRGKTAKSRYDHHPRSNTFDQFVEFCEFHKIHLNPEQKKVAAELFAIPYARGKSMLIVLLFGYDLSSQIYEEEYFRFLNNGHSLQEARAGLQDIRSLSGMLHQRCDHFEHLGNVYPHR